MKLNVLAACEESQAVVSAFRFLGHNAFSCDLKPCSGSYPQYHIQDDVLNVINDNWDLIIGFPPCTYLTNAGNRYRNLPGRSELRLAALDFFIKLYNSPCEFVAIENPCGYANSHFRKADQTIHPYFFAESKDSIDYNLKRTCLWLKNLPPLSYTISLPAPEPNYISYRSDGTIKKRYFTESVSCTDRAAIRSKTFPGVAHAMSVQWSEFVINKKFGYYEQLSFFDSSFC